ncbi:helix-turn-helix domain-containing protein [Thiotrichales bacterium 19X7-9]|nr:helix-turn-helix domain-containing protein [Thiotrichales bacterium 19X7-9]
MHKSFTHKLEQLMQNANITSASELAKLSGIPYSTLSEIITGISKKPSKLTLKKLASFFNVQVLELIDDIPHKKDIKDTADVLKYLLTLHLLSERDLSKQTGISQTSINDILHRKTTKLRENTIQKLCNSFNISREELLCERPLSNVNEHKEYQQNSKIPILEYKELFLLPDSLKRTENRTYKYISTDKNNFALYATNIKPILEMSPRISIGDLLILSNDSEPQHGDSIIILDNDSSIKIGDVINRNGNIFLMPAAFNSEITTLKLGHYRYLATIKSILKNV